MVNRGVESNGRYQIIFPIEFKKKYKIINAKKKQQCLLKLKYGIQKIKKKIWLKWFI